MGCIIKFPKDAPRGLVRIKVSQKANRLFIKERISFYDIFEMSCSHD